MTENKREKILFVINPISGGKSKAALPGLIKSKLSGSFEASIRFTDYPGQATELTKEALQNDTSRIVAVGGDGTVNEVAKALINTNGILGIIPAGSGNGLARHLKISMNTENALSAIDHGKVISIDSGNINGHPFFCTSGIGFDAHIGKLFAESSDRGFSTYVKTTFTEFFNYKPFEYELDINTEQIKRKAFFITFANSAQYGNNAFISPNADIQDGLLDVCIMAPFPKYTVMKLGFRLFAKSIHQSRYLKIIQTKELIVKREAAGAIHLDGEPYEMGKELNIKIIPSSLKVMVN